jgi:iron complex transport system permease protein
MHTTSNDRNLSQASHSSESPEGVRPRLKSRPLAAWLIIVLGLAALAFSMALAVAVGAADIRLEGVWDAILRFNPDDPKHHVIRELRIPRALAGAMVGASFAVAGAIMQGMTRNPLADSGLLGLNAGAGLALALCFALVPQLPFSLVMVFAFLGAAIGAGIVFGIGSLGRGGLTPVRLTLAGAAVSALLVALSEGIALLYNVAQDLAFWYAGGIAGVTWAQVSAMLPWICGGLLAALFMSRSVTLLSLGDDIATGLGQRTALVKACGMLVVLVMAGVSVSAVGGIAFVGLIIPHLARFLVGVDYRWIIPCSAVLGGLLMVLADIAARLINPPYETPIGALIALIGVPFFLVLARRGKQVMK